MSDSLIEHKVAEFAAELEVWNGYATGNVDLDAVAAWYDLVIVGLDAQQLLESVHRHVSVMRENSSNSKLYYMHLGMLGSVADEIERRRQEAENNNASLEDGS